MNISFLENWQFNNKSAPPLTHIPKDCPYNLTKYESKQNSEIPIFQLFSELGEIWKCGLSQHSKIPTFHHFHELETIVKSN